MPEPPAPRILITRSRDDAADWARALTERGARAVLLPCIVCEHIDTPAVRATLAAEAARCDWLVFTSRRGVAAFVELHRRPLAGSVRIAAVGPATAAACEQQLGRVDLVADRAVGAARAGTAAALAETLAGAVADTLAHTLTNTPADAPANTPADTMPGTLASTAAETRAARVDHAPPSVLLALAENAGATLERRLTAAGAHCTRVNVYRTVAAPLSTPKRALSSLGADNIFLASPSAVAGLVNQVDVDVPVAVFTIGPSTTAQAQAAGLEVTAEAAEPSLEGLLEAMQWPIR